MMVRVAGCVVSWLGSSRQGWREVLHVAASLQVAEISILGHHYKLQEATAGQSTSTWM
jgi:hypothetical protein